MMVCVFILLHLCVCSYRHLGSLAYIGGDKSVAEITNRYVINGYGAWWLWRSIYWSNQVSLRCRFLVAVDWMKTLCFGRDATRN